MHASTYISVFDHRSNRRTGYTDHNPKLFSRGAINTRHEERSSQRWSMTTLPRAMTGYHRFFSTDVGLLIRTFATPSCEHHCSF